MVVNSIADLLIRIKNGYRANRKTVAAPYFKLGEQVGIILVSQGYLDNLEINKAERQLVLTLKYTKKIPAIADLKQISKPGLRKYSQSKMIPKVKVGFGITIVSTSKGVMTDRQARHLRLGGEVICQVW